jgi:hypothetical protein
MPTAAAKQQPALKLVRHADEQPGSQIWFCSHCGHRHADSNADIVPRVCKKCSLGVLLCTSASAAPGPKDAFVVVDSSLTVQAVSRKAERTLEVQEQNTINRHVTELLIQADVEAAGTRGIAEAITSAAAGFDEPSTVTVRPSGSFGVRLRAKIVPCGPPSAALLVFG